MSDCIFCKIVAKKIPAHVVFESDRVLAFMNIQPIRPGHVLVIPKLHEPDLHKLSPDDYQAVMGVVHEASKRVADRLSPKRVGIMVMGWDVPHAHVHVVPMEDSGDITSKALLENTISSSSREELAEMAQRLSLALKDTQNHNPR
jgi:histidine triad (HIT) family protein